MKYLKDDKLIVEIIEQNGTWKTHSAWNSPEWGKHLLNCWIDYHVLTSTDHSIGKPYLMLKILRSWDSLFGLEHPNHRVMVSFMMYVMYRMISPHACSVELFHLSFKADSMANRNIWLTIWKETSDASKFNLLNILSGMSALLLVRLQHMCCSFRVFCFNNDTVDARSWPFQSTNFLTCPGHITRASKEIQSL